MIYTLYFDDELYKRRVVVEHVNAWIDSFKGLIVRFETTISSWIAMHYMGFYNLIYQQS